MRVSMHKYKYLYNYISVSTKRINFSLPLFLLDGKLKENIQICTIREGFWFPHYENVTAY